MFLNTAAKFALSFTITTPHARIFATIARLNRTALN